jgi:hypothetical protein
MGDRASKPPTFVGLLRLSNREHHLDDGLLGPSLKEVFMLDYKSETHTPNPVAIRLDQTEVHAPGHKDWAQVTCPACPDKFSIGHHQAFPSISTKQQVTKELLSALADDHSHGRNHRNSYEF